MARAVVSGVLPHKCTRVRDPFWSSDLFYVSRKLFRMWPSHIYTYSGIIQNGLRIIKDGECGWHDDALVTPWCQFTDATGLIWHAWFPLSPVPCAPQNVQVQMNCTAGAMTVTWATNPDAESFYVDAVSSNISLSCNTSGTSCSIRSLVCGLSLSITVRAVWGKCQSEPSAAVQALSGNCAKAAAPHQIPQSAV